MKEKFIGYLFIALLGIAITSLVVGLRRRQYNDARVLALEDQIKSLQVNAPARAKVASEKIEKVKEKKEGTVDLALVKHRVRVDAEIKVLPDISTQEWTGTDGVSGQSCSWGGRVFHVGDFSEFGVISKILCRCVVCVGYNESVVLLLPGPVETHEEKRDVIKSTEKKAEDKKEKGVFSGIF